MSKSDFDKPLKSNKITCKNIKKLLLIKQKIRIHCLLDYSYFKEKYQSIATDYANQKAIAKLNLTGNCHPPDYNNLKILSWVSSLIGNNNIRSAILEIKTLDVKSFK